MTHEEKLSKALALLDDPRLQPLNDAAVIALHTQALDPSRRTPALLAAVADVVSRFEDVRFGITPGMTDAQVVLKMSPLQRAVARALPLVEQAIGKQIADEVVEAARRERVTS